MPTPQEIKFIDCETGKMPVLQSLFGVKNTTKFMNCGTGILPVLQSLFCVKNTTKFSDCGTGILPVLQSLLIMIQHMSLSSPTESPKKNIY
jgi:sorbitol-specific phosphotransferase system component IIC